MQWIKKVFDASLLKFLLVGGINTVFSLAITYTLYNLLGLGYWGSTATAYIITSVTGFIFNRKFTFKSSEPWLISAVKFALVIGVCYGIAYSLAQPLVAWAGARWLPGLAPKTLDNLAFLVGQVLFTSLNYLGQKFFAFSRVGRGAAPQGEPPAGQE